MSRRPSAAVRLPRTAHALLERFVTDEEAREGVLGDLQEEYTELAGRYPRLLVGWWCSLAALAVVRRYRHEHRLLQARRNHRRWNPGGTMERITRELHDAARSLRSNPLFTAIVVVTLALGIGANTLVFTVIDGVVLSPLPYPEPDRLVRLYNFEPNRPERGSNFVVGEGFVAYRELTDVFEGLATQFTYREVGADLVAGDQPVRILAMPISAGLFETLGVELPLGREFRREEEDGSPVVILSHGLWRDMLGADPAAVGGTIRLDDMSYTVVGVAPAGFRNPLGWQVDVWTPENLHDAGRNIWDNNYLSAVGRLRPGVSVAAANARLDALSEGLHETYPESEGIFARVVPLIDDTIGDSRPMLYALAGAVTLVLLVVCVNVAGLFLARGAERARDVAVRAALGASRAVLLRQMLWESLLVGCTGGLLGVILAFSGVRTVVAANPDVPRLSEVSVDAGVLGFTLAISLLTTLLFGVLPALRLSRANVATTLRAEGRGASPGRGQQRLRHALVIAEIALAVILLVGAGLLAKSLVALSQTELGIRPDNVLSFEVHLPTMRYPEPADRIEFFARWFDRVRAVSGVEAVGAISYLPTEGRYHRWSFRRPDIGPDQQPAVDRDNRVVAGDYFEAMGIELVRGRRFGPDDTADSPRVVIINRYLAERAFPDRDPLGAPILLFGTAWQVVGIVDDTAHDPYGSRVGKLYYPHDQFAFNRNWALIQTVRTQGEPTSVVARLRAELREMDAELVLYRVRTMNDVIGRGISAQRFSSALMMLFAAVALVLAALGIYGVLAHYVASRTREIGIRMALGAAPGKVRRLIAARAATFTLAGLVLGGFGALIFAGWLGSLLFEVRPHDPWVLAGVTAGLLAVAAAAAYLPARRATSVDPASALRGVSSTRPHP